MTGLASPLPRADAHAKATGAARYAADIARPGMAFGVVVRSLHSAARLRVDPSAARDRGAIVLTASDLPDRRYGLVVPDEPLLARDRVRYVGEPVALVAADTLEDARHAAALVRVDYEPLPSVVSLDDALASGAPEVFEGEGNLIDRQGIERGDVSAAFAAADHVVVTEIVNQRVHQAYLEPRAALAEIDESGRLVVTTSSQAPFEVRTGLAVLFDLPLARIRVVVPALGGGFGGKLHLGMAPHAVALCLAARRPVQVVCPREDEFQSPAPRENGRVRIASAVRSDGRILGRRVEIVLDSGAYAYDTMPLASAALLQAAGAYEIPALEASAIVVRTNTVPTASFRAPTGPQMAFANETHVDDIAALLGLPPLAVRRANAMRAGSLGPSGQRIAASALDDLLDRVAAVVEGWLAAPAEPRPGGGPRRRGVGLACTWWNTLPAGGAASVMLGEDGSAIVHVGATEIGTGAVSATLAGIVSEALGIAPEQVTVRSGDTDGPVDFGSQGSRTLYGVGTAVLEATRAVRAILADQLVEGLEADAGDVRFGSGTVWVAGSPETARPLADVVAGATRRGGPIVGSGRFGATVPPHDEGCLRGLHVGAFNEPTFHCHAAEVDVDEETGRVEVLRYVAAHDCGRALNRSAARGQVEGGVVQGMGYALYEEVLTGRDGATRNASLVDYRLPTIEDVPEELTVILHEGHPGTSPLGVKGIGEPPVILPASAIGAAIRAAIGDVPRTLPFTPAVVLACIDAQGLR